MVQREKCGELTGKLLIVLDKKSHVFIERLQVWASRIHQVTISTRWTVVEATMATRVGLVRRKSPEATHISPLTYRALYPQRFCCRVSFSQDCARHPPTQRRRSPPLLKQNSRAKKSCACFLLLEGFFFQVSWCVNWLE